MFYQRRNIGKLKKKVWTEVSGKEGVKNFENGSNVQFSNNHKQLQASLLIYADFEFILKKDINLIEIILIPLILINFKSILLVVMVAQLYVLLIDLVNQCIHIEMKMQYTDLLKKCLKNVIIIKKLLKSTLRKNS